jgi:hypothetical protein
VEFDTKVAVVLRDDLAGWQRANVTAFVISGIVATTDGATGPAYEDGSGNTYLPMLIQPVQVFETDAAGLRRAWERALARDVTPAIYTADLFATMNDDDNRAAVKAVQAEDLDLVGLALRADRKIVDKVLDKVRRHT